MKKNYYGFKQECTIRYPRHKPIKKTVDSEKPAGGVSP